MATAAITETLDPPTLADVLAQLGDVPAHRVLLRPVPGTATEQDLIDLMGRTDRLYELVDGVLVEKAIGCYEDLVGTILIQFMGDFVRARDLGVVLGAAGYLRLMPGSVRAPDVSFISWSKLPSRRFPKAPLAPLVPDLAIEVLSPSNTHAEMERKLGEYFAAGVRLVWYIDPELRSARIYTSAGEHKVVRSHENLDGGDVLPGFSLPLADLFRVERETE